MGPMRKGPHLLREKFLRRGRGTYLWREGEGDIFVEGEGGGTYLFGGGGEEGVYTNELRGKFN